MIIEILCLRKHVFYKIMYLRVFLCEELLLLSSYYMIQIKTKKDKMENIDNVHQKAKPLIKHKSLYLKI